MSLKQLLLFLTCCLYAVSGSETEQILRCGGCTFFVSQDGLLYRNGSCSADCTSLDLSLRGIKNISQGALTGLTSLHLLSLDSNELSDLDAETFAGLANLYYLFLSDNLLESLPDEIFQGLSKLYLLSLENNKLSGLAAGVFNAASGSLQYLFLSNNQLTSLPATVFSGTSSLYYLFLSGNQLSRIPTGAFNGLYQLYSLSLDHNELSSLAGDTFNALYSLGRLSLNHNRLRCIPTWTFEYLALAYIDIRNNSLPCYQTDWPPRLQHDELQACTEETDCNGMTSSVLCPAGSYSITGNLIDLEDCEGVFGRGGCKCAASSVKIGLNFPCTNGYDNNLNSMISTYDFSGPETMTNWVMIDLGTVDGLSKDVSRVTLVSRAECCWERTDNVQVYIGDDGMSAVNNVLCGTYRAFTSISHHQTLECGLRGRYVWVYKEYSTLPMNWAEMTIQGCNPCPMGLTTERAGARSISECINLSNLSSRQVSSASNISLIEPIRLCQLNVSWNEIIRNINEDSPVSGCYITGGLGTLMIKGVEEVWVCQYGHPCAQNMSTTEAHMPQVEGDSFCFIFEEMGKRFRPWGLKSELGL